MALKVARGWLRRARVGGAPLPVKLAMRAAARVMTLTAHRV